MESSVRFLKKNNGSFLFSYKNNTFIISFASGSICRFSAYSKSPKKSLMVKLGYVKEQINQTQSVLHETRECYKISGEELKICINKDGSGISVSDLNGTLFFTMLDMAGINPGKASHIAFSKSETERFHGFGFQRKTLDANGHKLIFKKSYRWSEATVPYFLCSAGYGFFSANTFEHSFDFTKNGTYSINTTGGDLDFFIIRGFSYKEIIQSYTDLTGRPHMVPAYSLGLCYVGRLFETQEGIMSIAKTFRSEGIPCDMIGLEPGWEKYYYQMKWVWNENMFPNPERMIKELHSLGYAFELWESGDAPVTGYLKSNNRKKWFAQRISTSLDIGVDFYKQDDPYPRCITSEEMVTNPSVDILMDDEESKNVANTLYSTTVFDEMRRITGKRAFIIFHAYCSTISSQMYPCVWAGDFGLGNGALNASLSGHAMVTQDMRSEAPSGIHFGFLMPFTFMDSWAYYLEPWLLSDHIKKMIRFYSRLRVSLFPYLYTALWQSHSLGLPIMRPMLLEFQNDSSAQVCENQYMLGESFLVGLNRERDTTIYLPKGKWIDYWSRKTINSMGSVHICTWPSYAGGPLFIRAGAIIPMMNASDSIVLNEKQFLLLDIYPDGNTSMELYEDDGISYDYEKGEYTLYSISSADSDKKISINIDKINKAVITRIYMCNNPDCITANGKLLMQARSMEILLTSYNAGWFFDSYSNSLNIKGITGWKLKEIPEDSNTFYNCSIDFNDTFNAHALSLEIHKTTARNSTEPAIADTEQMPSDCRFKAVVNPPERVRLNHGDDWLPYYIYVGYEIISAGKVVSTANPEVKLEISYKDNRDIDKTYTSIAFQGVGHFEKIIVSSPTEPPDIKLTLTADGVSPCTLLYKV